METFAEMLVDERNDRFSSLYQNTIEHFITSSHIVIGCGAIGGPIIKTLGQIGIKKITMWDHDTVEEVNIGPQGFTPDEIGCDKTESRQNDFKNLNPRSWCIEEPRRFSRRYDHDKEAYWWLCVDDLDTRVLIYDVAIDHEPHRIIDTRMGGLNYEVYNAPIDDSQKYMETIQFARDNPVNEGCTSRSTPHTSMVAASIGINLGLTENPPFSVIGNMMDYNQTVVW